MGFYNWIKSTADEALSIGVDATLAPHMPALIELAQKDYDYSAYTPEAQQQMTFDGFAVPNVNTFWTDGTNYKDKADKLTKKCAVSARCLQMRSDALAAVPLKVTGNSNVQQLFRHPNFSDKTWQAAVAAWSYHLGVAGQLFLFLDMSVSDRATIEALRPDLVARNVKQSRWEYNPGAMANANSKPDMLFDYDATSATTAAWKVQENGSYRKLDAALIVISYFDPTSPTKGLAPGDAALRAVDTIMLIEDLVNRKFRAGGTKNGFFKWNQGTTGRDQAALQAQIATLNQGNNLQVMPQGMDFVAAQLSFADMDISGTKLDAAKDVCTAFGVDPASLGQTAGTHANTRANDKIFYRNWTGPQAWWLVGQLEAAIRKYLDPRASVAVDETQIPHIQDDLDDKMTKWASTGVVTVDECRAVVGLPPLPNGEGKVLATTKPQPTDDHTGLGQPDTKPGGETAFNADAGDRGDRNNNG